VPELLIIVVVLILSIVVTALGTLAFIVVLLRLANLI